MHALCFNSRVLFFIITPSYRRRFRPRRPSDSIPVRPLIDVMLYWCCTTFGGLFASVGIVALLANQFTGVPFERGEITFMAALAALSPLLFFVAIRSWRKLNR
jgi:hypothetical protein